jgi:hypothetical protein
LGYKKLEQRITYALFPAPSFTVFPLKQLKIQNSKYSFPTGTEKQARKFKI